jgi:uncharacterized membrane protein YGL010W
MWEVRDVSVARARRVAAGFSSAFVKTSWRAPPSARRNWMVVVVWDHAHSLRGEGQSMGDIFRRFLLEYAEYHRDERNCLMHLIGNPILAVAAFLPFSLLPVTVFGLHTNAAAVLVIPALLFWMALDVTIGLAIAASAVPLLLVAALIAAHVSVAWVWTIAIGLFVIGWAMQIFGHKYFEGGWPALLDNPMHMLMSPMFVFAKMYVALGLRPDLVSIVRQPALQGQHP